MTKILILEAYDEMMSYYVILWKEKGAVNKREVSKAMREAVNGMLERREFRFIRGIDIVDETARILKEKYGYRVADVLKVELPDFIVPEDVEIPYEGGKYKRWLGTRLTKRVAKRNEWVMSGGARGDSG